MNKPKDKLGNDIEIGSFIVYGHPLGRCAGLRVGIVKDIKNNPDKIHKEDEYIFIVRGIDDDWMYDNPWDFSKLRLNIKDGRLSYCNRIIVLNNIPKQYQELLALDKSK